MQTGGFKRVAIEAALDAGAFIEKHVGKKKSVRYKSDINVVTDVDKKAEDIIVGRIRKHYPAHNVLAEEKKYAKRKERFLWVIDPLDGTTNFLHGFPFFCASIALSYCGEVVVGVVYDPIRKELFCAEKSKGAYLNGRRIAVSKIKNLKKALVATGFAYNMKDARNKNISNFVKFLKTSQAVRRAGSAALDLCYVASGRFDGFWEFRLNPWDTAAGVLIAEEAGGKATKVDRSKYTIYDKEVLVTNSRIHSQMSAILKG